MKRVFLIVLDSVGAGYAKDAALFSDEGSNTLKSVYNTGKLHIPNLVSMGLGNIKGLSFLGTTDSPKASYARLCEISAGKDTTIGHWEIAGLVSEKPFPTYPNGFPEEIIKEFSEKCGRGVLCNKPYSGTEVISDYGGEHIRTGKLIVYTSADSVFQIAAHEDVVPLPELYKCCETARKILKGENAVARVIARPFAGTGGSYTRTASRRDFSLAPPRDTMLDKISAEKAVVSIGKIADIFAQRGVTESIHTHSNKEGMEETLRLLDRDFSGLVFTNLVDFDTLYGHRNNAAGYALALNEFDNSLPAFLEKMNGDDCLIITADHGCDPGDISTDHTRENVPCLIYSPSLPALDLGEARGFSNIAKTVCDMLDIDFNIPFVGFYNALSSDKPEDALLLDKAREALLFSYSPYSKARVGAALLTKSGGIYTGANIENAAYSPSVCAERAAFFRAVSEGEREFSKIAVVSDPTGFMPCGVCRQVMREFCGEDFEIITPSGAFTLGELLPRSFSQKNIDLNSIY